MIDTQLAHIHIDLSPYTKRGERTEDKLTFQPGRPLERHFLVGLYIAGHTPLSPLALGFAGRVEQTPLTRVMALTRFTPPSWGRNPGSRSSVPRE